MVPSVRARSGCSPIVKVAVQMLCRWLSRLREQLPACHYLSLVSACQDVFSLRLLLFLRDRAAGTAG